VLTEESSISIIADTLNGIVSELRGCRILDVINSSAWVVSNRQVT
jgi:hypothetical protein